ncbi:hypothetical protein [Vibrio harveyi]
MKTLLDLGLSEEEKNNLLRGIFEGKYNLLLGAGASYGCRGGDGVELKDGASTAKEIAKDFKLEIVRLAILLLRTKKLKVQISRY